jgi:hypothetical protein
MEKWWWKWLSTSKWLESEYYWARHTSKHSKGIWDLNCCGNLQADTVVVKWRVLKSPLSVSVTEDPLHSIAQNFTDFTNQHETFANHPSHEHQKSIGTAFSRLLPSFSGSWCLGQHRPQKECDWRNLIHSSLSFTWRAWNICLHRPYPQVLKSHLVGNSYCFSIEKEIKNSKNCLMYSFFEDWNFALGGAGPAGRRGVDSCIITLTW